MPVLKFMEAYREMQTKQSDHLLTEQLNTAPDYPVSVIPARPEAAVEICAGKKRIALMNKGF